MLDTEYNEEEVMELFKRDSFLEGRAEGLAEGKAEARLSSVKSLMENMNLTLENTLDILGIKGDEREAVLKEIKE